LIITIRTGL